MLCPDVSIANAPQHRGVELLTEANLSSDSNFDRLQQALASPEAYEYGEDSIEVIETHISLIYLIGDYAYKVKKPLRTSFLDYSTIELRKKACEDEVRLDRRYARDLYIGVVPIVENKGRIIVDGVGDAVEYAVKMHRFPSGELLSQRVREDRITIAEVRTLAERISHFHQEAKRCDPSRGFGLPDDVLQDAMENLDAIELVASDEMLKLVRVLRTWTLEFHSEHFEDFKGRIRNRFIRECHGDLHLGNIVSWNKELVPFDGIEFNERFRCIDTLSDAAFTAMDFAACDRLDLSRSFINAYLDASGDHSSLSVLRWYLVYRALVRAKVAVMRIAQAHDKQAKKQLSDYLDLAYRYTLREEPFLWITHGVSGSGKTTVSEEIVQRHGAIRLRSDVERKRYMGMCPNDRPDDHQADKLYCKATNQAIYARLQDLAKRVIYAGYPVVIDATFLRQHDRDSFRQTAEQLCATFRIIHCHADERILRQRICSRLVNDSDASDADLNVLEMQLHQIEPLTKWELPFVIDVGNQTDFIETRLETNER